MHRGSMLSGLALAVPVIAQAAPGTVIHVDDDALPGGDGLTWKTAFDDLTDALQAAAPPVDEIWVAAGTYTPRWPAAGGDPRDVYFWLLNDVSILGGFAGDESDAADRDPIANPTILSGELGVPADPTDNAYHVVRAGSTIDDTAVLDGFVLTGGYADGYSWHGGGARLESCDPVIGNCRFVDNVALDDGGAVWCTGSPTFIDCTFVGNLAVAAAETSSGGAVYGTGGPVLVGCTFEDNHADGFGGAAWIQNGTIESCLFEGNVAVGGGGAVLGAGNSLDVTDSVFIDNQVVYSDGGAIQCSADRLTVIGSSFINNATPDWGGAISGAYIHDSVVLVGCFFLGNAGDQGGAVMTQADVLEVTNCTFSGNAATSEGGGVWSVNDVQTLFVNSAFVANWAAESGGGIYTPSDSADIANCVFWHNSDAGGFDETAQVHATGTLTVNYTLLQGLTGGLGGTGNLDADPQFVDANGPDLLPGTADDDLRLLPGSPCIDAGDNDAVPADAADLDGDGNVDEPVPFDGYGGPRFLDDPDTVDSGNGTPPIVDIGAYEYDGTTTDPGPHPGEYVGPPGGSWFDPGHWAGGAVPGADTNVLILTSVEIDQPGAEADVVRIDAGGVLVIGTGSLTATQIIVTPGSTLVLDHPSAWLEVETVSIQFGGSVQWNAGTAHVATGWDDPNGIELGCVGQATLELDAGAAVTAPTVNICTAGALVGGGTINGDLGNDGSVTPGRPLTVRGSFTQSVGGTLTFVIDGYAAGGFDQLLVYGTATLDGAVNVLAAGGFLPELAGDQRIVRAWEVDGNFMLEDLAELPGDFIFELAYDVPADGDLDQTVQLITTLTGTGPRIYVNVAVAPGGDGQSWATPTNDLSAALEFATLFPGVVNEIWVAAGVYSPARGTGAREASFVLVPDVAVYGGFVGNETDLEQRDWAANVTTLTGDLNGDDGPNFTNRGDNSIHVVTTTFDGTEDPVLDGFLIISGQADAEGPNDPGRRGGGLYNRAQHATIANCTFTDNQANRGGAVNDASDGAVFSQCVFDGNRASDDGGALRGGNGLRIGCTFVDNSASWGGAVAGEAGRQTFEDCVFQTNDAYRGGAIFGESVLKLTLVRCTFVSNDAWNQGGALHLDDSGCAVDAVDCEFIVNTAEFGGALSGGSNDYAFTGCLFEWNIAVDGGAVGGTGSPGWFIDCTFVDNESFGEGGAMDLNWNTTILIGCTFRDQHARTDGGAIRLQHGALVVFGGEFSGNLADERGGAVTLYTDATVEAYGVAMVGNSTAGMGGAVSAQYSGAASFANCLLAGNAAFNGGAVHTATADPGFINCTFVDNAAAAGGAVFNDGAAPVLSNCILWGNVPDSINPDEPLPVVTYSDVEGGIAGAGNIDADPGFIDRDGPDDDPATVDDNDYRLAAGSPCIDAADNTVVLQCGVLDFDGLSRFVDDPLTADTGIGDPPIVDMGAWEYGAGTSADDCNGNGIADACDSELHPEADCDGNGIPDVCEWVDCNENGETDQCDLLNGTSPDCNGNSVPDECDVAGGGSTDCNEDGVPDECSDDCNDNGIPDVTDICDGTSADVNGNDVPDECECVADIDHNGVVNIWDFTWLINAWGGCGYCAEDINKDGEVGVLDFLLLMANWGPCSTAVGTAVGSELE